MNAWPPPDPVPPFYIGDLVLLPDDTVATVVSMPWTGQVSVETPWEVSWQRFDPSELRLLVREEER